MKRFVVPIIVGLVAGAVWAVIGPSLAVGVMPYGEIAVYGARFIAGPLLLIAIVLLAVSRGRWRLLPGICTGVSLFLLVSLLGVSRADCLKRGQNRMAREFCEALIPKLDAYKREHGDYPDGIESMLPEDRRSLSVYLRDGSFYFKRTNGYTFGWCDSPRFPLCSGVSSYHSGSGKWDRCADWGITMMSGSLVEKPHLVTETVGVEIKEPDYQEMERRRIQKMTLVDDVSRTDFADSPRASP